MKLAINYSFSLFPLRFTVLLILLRLHGSLILISLPSSSSFWYSAFSPSRNLLYLWFQERSASVFSLPNLTTMVSAIAHFVLLTADFLPLFIVRMFLCRLTIKHNGNLQLVLESIVTVLFPSFSFLHFLPLSVFICGRLSTGR